MKKILTLMCMLTAILTACNGKSQSTGKAGETQTKILIAYFSCTGHTKQAAETIARITKGDLYAITPAEAYTAADLDWRNDKSRSSREMGNSASRPSLAGKKVDIASYDIVYLGYPIWWGVCPRIINTFLETYDFKGKKVIPFATSGSSSIAQSESELHKLYKEIRWGKGLLMNNVSRQEVQNWVNEEK